MTGPEHAAEAERLLSTLDRYSANRHMPSNPAGRAAAIAQAQVHATLALVAATTGEQEVSS